MHQYRPDSTSTASSRSKSMVCTDACVFAPQITCNPVMAPSLLVSQFGNASFEGFSTWTGDLEANETGRLNENPSGALQFALSYGGRATFICRKGYIASGNLTECTGYLHIDALADGTLRGADQYCKQIVCDAQTINQADYVIPPIIELGSNGTVTCNAGYRAGPPGLEFMACADEKTYSVRCAGCKFESDMECLPVRCNTTGSITMNNATKSVSRNPSKVLYPESVNVLCNTGYRIGTHNATGAMSAVGECAEGCRLNRDLNCLPVFCDTSALPTANSAWAVGESGAGGMYYGEVAKIVCNAGYIVDGGTCLSSFMVGCDSYGNVWNSNKVCNMSTRCTRPQDSNSIITSDISTSGAQNYGSTATISCNFGYGVQTKPATYAPCDAPLIYTGTCLQDCTFSASESCVPYMCAISDLSDGLRGTGVVNHSIGGVYAYYGDTVTIRCNAGYTFGSATSKLRITQANCSQSVCGSFVLAPNTSLCVALQCNRIKLNTGNATMVPSPSNPSATAIMLNYLESYVLTCNAGFMLASGGRNLSTYTTQFTSTCGDNGDMSGLDEYCVPIPCTLAVDSNAAGIQLHSTPAASSSDLVYGTEVNVTCKHGFRAADLSLSSCDDDRWYVGTCETFVLSTSRPGMSCKPVVCSGLANIRSRLSFGAKGDWTSSMVLSSANDMNYGDTITVSCNSGFSFGSPVSGQSMKTLTCTCHPKPWAPDDVNCVQSGCNVSMLPPANAGPAMNNTEELIGTALNITCNSGFYVESSPSNSSHYQTSFISTCGSDGTMTKLQERCKTITCKTVDQNQASQNPLPGMPFGTDVNVTCKNGYKAAARESTAAECSNHDSYQASCRFFDYFSSSECKQVFCDLTSVQSNLVGKGVSSSNVTALKYGDSVQITCNTGFRFGGQADVRSKTVTCGCPWVAQNVNCTSVACDLSGLKLAVANITGVVTTPGWPPAEDIVNYGTQFTVLCSYGYSVDGASFAQDFTTMCGDDRKMTNVDRRCVPGNCTGIADANQASQSSSPRYYGENVLVTCKAGHRASSATSSTCDNEQTYNSNCTGFSYTPIIPSTACRQIKCGNLNSIRSSLAGKGTMTSTASEIAYGESFSVSCNTGYRFANHSTLGPTSATVSCSCPWSPNTLNCSAVQCRSPLFPPGNASVTTGWTDGQLYPSFGEYTIKCNTGYLLQSAGSVRANYLTEFTMRCGNDGLLTNTAERCTRIPCHNTPPVDPQQKTQVPSGTTFHDDSLVITCNDGYRSSASSSSTCNQSEHYNAKCSVWDIVPAETNTSCKRVFCDLEAIRSTLAGKGNLSSTSASFGYGDTVNVTCNYGTRFGGSGARSATVTCACPWLASNTNCTPVKCSAAILPASNPKATVKESGWVSSSTVTYGTSFTIMCNPGFYHVRGSRHFSNYSTEVVSTCQDDGYMSNISRPVIVECLRITCGQADPHGNQTCTPSACPDGPVFGNRVLVTCNAGYRSTSPAIPHDCATGAGNKRYEADCGAFTYVPVSDPTVSVSPVRKCTPVICGGINKIRSSLDGTGMMQYQGETLTYGTAFDVTCNTGYRFVNPVNQSSPRHGKVVCDCPFDDSQTCVKVQCNASALPPAGATVTAGLTGNSIYEWNTTLQVSCNPGYVQAQGSCRRHFDITCNEDGEWISPTGGAYCVQREMCYEHIENCSVGYAAVSVESSATCSNGSSYLATCIDICTPTNDKACKPVECHIPVFEGTPVPSRVFYNESITAECKLGYRFKSTEASAPKTATVKCRNDCNLSEPLECHPIVCNARVLSQTGLLNIQESWVDNISAVNFSLGFHDQVRMYCRNTTIVESSPPGHCASSYLATCVDDGSIQGSVGGSLKCVPRFCDLRLLWDSNDAGNATVVYDNNLAVIPNSNRGISEGAQVLVACNTGYRISSHSPSAALNASTSCLPNCNFDPAHSCKPVECQAASVPPPNSYVSGRSWTNNAGSNKLYFGEILNVTCNAGHMVASSPKGTCRRWFEVGCNDTGLLVGAYERCIRVNCGQYESDENRGAMNPLEGAYTGHQASVTCKEGYRAAPVSNESTTCAAAAFYDVQCGACQYDIGPHHCAIAQCGPFNLTQWEEPLDRYLNFRNSTPFHGQGINVPCAYAHRAALAHETYAQCFRNTSLSATCNDCSFTSPHRCRLVVCDTVDNVSTVSQGQMIHGTTGSMSCKAGYRASKAGEMPPSCENPTTFEANCSDCQYLTASTQCRRVMCNLSSIQNSQGLESLAPNVPYAVYEDQLLVSCLPGFRPMSDMAGWTRTLNTTCAGDCELSFTDLVDSPVCSPVACMAFSIPANASTNKTVKYVRFAQKGSTPPPEMTGSHSLVFGDTISVTCDAGYTRASLFAPGVCRNNYTVTCSEKGLTQNKNESCRPIACSKYADDPNMASVEKGWNATYNASMEAVSVDYGSSATVKCKQGFLATSSTAQCGMPSAYNITCNDWKKCTYTQTQFCQPVECQIPEFEGTTHPARSFFNESLVIACKSAYRFKSKHVNGPKNRSLSCNKNCSLSEDPVCLPITCNASWLHYRGTSNFGIKNRTFARNLTLDANQHFEFHCNDSLIAKNGPPGACQTTYKVICVDDGSIESALGSFQCVPPFCDLRLFERASKYWHETVVYAVHAAKSSNSSNSSLFTKESITRLKSNESELLGGQNVIVACNTGYRMNTTDVYGPRNASTTCHPSNCNFASIPVCMPVRCNASALPPPNAHVSGNTWLKNSTIMHFGELLNISCNPNYMVEGSSYGDLRTWFLVGCNDTGGLIGIQRCVRANCGEYNGDPHVNPLKGTNTFDEAVVTCKSGYRRTPRGASPVNCSVNERSYNLSCASNLGYYHMNATDLQVCTPLRCGHFEVLEYNGGPRQFPAHDQLRLLPGLRSLPEYSVFGFAGGQLPGFQDGSAINARLRRPARICLWNKQSPGTEERLLLISAEHHIRTLSAQSGEFTTWVGSNQPGFQDAMGTNARFLNPAGVAVGQVCEQIGQTKYCADIAAVADSGNHRIRRIEAVTKNVVTWAGSGTRGFSNGVGTYAKFNYPRDVIYQQNALGEFVAAFIADSGNNRIRRLNLTSSEVTTLSGSSEFGFVDGPATAARFFDPQSLALSPDGNTLYVADAGNHRIRAIHVSDGSVRTLAGSGLPGSADGIGTRSSFHNPRCVTVSVDGTRLLISDTTNNRIRSLDPMSGRVFTLAGSGSRGFLSEGTDVAFAQPEGLLILNSLVYVADSENNLIRNLTFTPTSDTLLTMALPYKHVPSVASSIHGQNVSLECGNNYRAAAKGHTYAFCSAGRTVNVTCDECLGSSVLASYSGDKCVDPACDPISNISTQTRQAIVNGEHGRIYCNPGYRAINGTLRAANENPDCSFPQSFLALCNDCNYDMRSWESNDEWLTCNLIKCDLTAIRQKEGVSSVLPARQTVLYQSDIRIKCKPGYRPQDHNVLSPIEVDTNCSDRCTATFPDPVCKPVACPAWKVPSHSHVVGIDFGNGSFVKASSFTEPTTLHYPQKVKVRCLRGFKLASNPSLSSCIDEYEVACDENATVRASQESCIPIQCPMIPKSNSYLPHNRPIAFHERTQAACNIGYRPAPAGQSTMGCTAGRVFEMQCAQCEFITNYTCVRCSDPPGKCPPYTPYSTQTVQEDLLPVHLKGINGSYNLSALEEVVVACPAGFGAVVPGLMLLEAPQEFSSGVYSVKCEYDGFLSGATVYCTCVSPAIELGFDQTTGLSECQCQAGYYGTVPSGKYGRLNCEQCPTNSFSSQGASSLLACGCNAGFYGEDVTDCRTCPPKSFSNFGSRLLSECRCAVGTYKKGSTCADCPDNSTSKFDSQDINDCRCNAGFQGYGEVGCSACHPASQWRSAVCEVDQKYCTECDCNAGYYGDGVTCTNCPGDATSIRGENSKAADCDCPEGFYQLGEGCEPCPEHSISAAGSTSFLQCVCTNGYYFDSIGMRCQSCPPMKTSPVGSNSVSDCFCSYTYRSDNGTCYRCPDRSHHDLQLGMCICDAGYIMQGPVDDENSVCRACEVGKYWVLNKNMSTVDPGQITTCVQCFDYATTQGEAGVGIDDCFCMKGYSYPAWCDGATCGPCQSCPAGKYSDFIGRGPCTNCVAGSFTYAKHPTVSLVGRQAAESREDCTCNIGFEARVVDGLGECRMCAAGEFYTYNVSAATWGCLSCKPNMYSQPGSTSCFCNAGYSGPDCAPCVAGKFKSTTGSGVCTGCPDHSSALNGSAVCLCNAGFESGSGICRACPAGKYKDATANVNCRHCLPQMSTSTVGTQLERDCKCIPGWFEIKNAPNSSKMDIYRYCSPCENGKYKDTLSDDACFLCPAGAYSRIAATKGQIASVTLDKRAQTVQNPASYALCISTSLSREQLHALNAPLSLVLEASRASLFRSVVPQSTNVCVLQEQQWTL